MTGDNHACERQTISCISGTCQMKATLDSHIYNWKEDEFGLNRKRNTNTVPCSSQIPMKSTIWMMSDPIRHTCFAMSSQSLAWITSDSWARRNDDLHDICFDKSFYYFQRWSLKTVELRFVYQMIESAGLVRQVCQWGSTGPGQKQNVHQCLMPILAGIWNTPPTKSKQHC